LLYRNLQNAHCSDAMARGSLVSDIFREVDEEVRREQFKKLWDKWGNYLVGLAVVAVLAVAGWRGFEWWQAKKAAEAGSAFEAALVLAEAGKHQEAEAAFSRLAEDSTAGYRLLARFREAAELARQDRAAAVKAYDALAADTGLKPLLRDLANVRAGIILVDTASLAELRARLEPLAGADRPFRHTARELIALAAWRAGDVAAARRWLDMIASDPETPAGTRSRAEVLSQLAGAAGKG
jgi:hypothetical protein